MPTTLFAALFALMLAAPAGAQSLMHAQNPDDSALAGHRLGRTDEAAFARRLLAGQDLAPLVAAAARTAGVDVDVPAVPAPANPLAALAAAVRHAEARAPEPAHHAVATLLAEGRTLQNADAVLRSRGTGGAGRLVAAAEGLAARARATVDAPRLFGNALLLAAAIDAALGPLVAHAVAVGTTEPHGPVTGCDLLDIDGLCVGGLGDNVHDGDHALLVDLGGEDVYRGGAASADPLFNGLAVSVVIDVAGDDRYETSQASGAARAVQGGAGLGGIAYLLDLDGDDIYTANNGTAAATMAQGAGLGGVGALLDAAGNDRYTVSAERAGTVSAQGQGRSIVSGAGILADLGGDDTYGATSRSVAVLADGTWDAGSANTAAHGAANLAGAAIFVDASGTDRMSARASNAPIDAGSDAPVRRRAVAQVDGAGHGTVGAAGWAVTGAGSALWEATAEVGPADAPAPKGSSGTLVQGLGLVGGFGALVDAGGADRYTMSATSSTQRDLAEPGGTADVLSSDVFSNGQGYGSTGGVGVLRDLGGDDRYEAAARTRAELRLVRAADGSAGGQAIAQLARVNVQAYAALGGVARLQDDGGDDAYTAAAETFASAHGPAGSGVAAEARDALSEAQAVGGATGAQAQLEDLGGRDTYTATARADAETAGGSDPVTGFASTTAQGSSGLTATGAVGTLLDLADGGAQDMFTTQPKTAPACTGVRGEGAWVDCRAPSGGLNTG